MRNAFARVASLTAALSIVGSVSPMLAIGAPGQPGPERAVPQSACYVPSMIDPQLQRSVVSFTRLRFRAVSCGTAASVVTQVTLQRAPGLQWVTAPVHGWRCMRLRPVLAPAPQWVTDCHGPRHGSVSWTTTEDI